MLARTYLQPGDVYDPAAVEQTFNSLWNTGYFDDVRIERVDEPKCIQLLIYVREKPTIRAINYTGLNAVTVSDVLDRFKKEKVGAHRREPVRPHQAQARRGRPQGDARRARSPVRRHPH